jgi:malate dehydrogenase (oxaloacetate-decarboxylating)(NADP+)
VQVDGRRFAPSQTNNAYVFPGVGLAVTATGARRVTDEMLIAAAESLAGQADEATLRDGALLPPLDRIREVSLRIALAVARVVIDAGLAGRETPADLEAYLRNRMYRPDYRPYV